MARTINAGNRSEKMASALANREDVKGSNLRGQSKDAGYMMGTGRLNANDAQKDALEKATYVVYSYATPIACFVPGMGWIMLDGKYSVTTTNHQNITRRATNARATL